MTSPIASVSRRQFLGRSACNAAGLAAGLVGLSTSVQAASANETVRLGIIGVRRQGRKLASVVAGQANASVVAICDVDESVLDRAQRELAEVGQNPRRVSDFRRVLDRSDVDAVIIATPDHSHAVIALEAVRAGKDLYLESPVCHTIAEGRALEDAAATSHQIIFSGMFDRSLDHVKNAIHFVQRGELGSVFLAKAWAVHRRATEPVTETRSPLAGVDYDRWLYPKRERPFDANRFHRGWANYWEYGSGELGTWGVPLLDVARWGLGLGLPTRVSAIGGYASPAVSETPNTLHVQYACGESTIVWEHRDWSNHAPEGRSAGVAFYGEAGTLILDRGGWKVYDSKNAITENGRADLAPHVTDFLDAVRTRRSTVAGLRDAIVSANYCHLGNLAFRLGHEVTVDGNVPLLVTGSGAESLVNDRYRPGVSLS